MNKKHIDCVIYHYFMKNWKKAVYIAKKLQNPQAANKLIDSVEQAIQERLLSAESFEKYHSI